VGRTRTSTHRAAPVKEAAGKSSEAEKTPPFTVRVRRRGSPTEFPPEAASRRVKTKSKDPLAGAPPLTRRPW